MSNDIGMQLRNAFERIITDYGDMYEKVKDNDDWKNPFRNIISKEIPELIQKGLDLKSPYSILGSYGKGRWTLVPWIAIFDTRITSSAQKGVYIVYLLNKDTKELYLAFEIATTEEMGTKIDSKGNATFVGVVKKNSPELKAKLQERAEQIRKAIKDTYFNKDKGINSGAPGYDSGAVYYKRYQVDTLPSGDVLLEDLSQMISIYKRYYEWIKKSESVNPEIYTSEKGGEDVSVSIKKEIKQIKTYIKSKGFYYKEHIIENYFLSLKTKPFVILAGISGTGKTRLVKLFAEAIDAKLQIVPVRPDWSDSSDLFGHLDLNGKYISGTIIEFIKEASMNINKPYFLCLDEMNLARVEYYLSDFLSIMETRNFIEGNIISEVLLADDKYGDDNKARSKYGNLRLPENLYIVGTVNMDETTFPFSKKVLDRANTIEFNHVNLIPDFSDCEKRVDSLSVTNKFLITDYLILQKDVHSNDQDYIKEVCVKLEEINQILKKSDSHVGYRTRDEICFYMLNNKNTNLISEEEAFDNEIMQKILPRIQGSSAGIKELLCELFKLFAHDYTGFNGADVSDKMIAVLNDTSKTIKYRKSAEKICFMIKRYEEDGFTSFWV